MIKTLILQPLGPSLILGLGGLVLLLLSRRSAAPRPARPGADDLLQPSAERWTVLLGFLVLAAAGGVLIRLRAAASGPVTLQWAWQPLTVAGSTVSWRLDGWNWLAALLILCVCAAVFALLAGAEPANVARNEWKVKQAVRTLWLAAAAVAFVCSDNLVTLAGCWVALDAALAFRLLPGQRAQPAARAWGGLSLAGLLVLAALIFQGETNARTALSSGAFSQPVLALVWVAALARAGAYPLHLWLFGAGGISDGDRVALHLIGPATGIWLLARVQSAGPAWLHRPEWTALGALALLGTALAACASPEPAGAWRWIAVNRASLVVLTAYVAAAGGPPALALSLVAFTLGAGLLALGQVLHVQWKWGLPAWLGALALWGIPGTPGFLARSALALPANLELPAPGGTATQIPAGPFLFALIVVAETLLVAALWHTAGGATMPLATREPADQEARRRSLPSNGATVTAAHTEHPAAAIPAPVPSLEIAGAANADPEPPAGALALAPAAGAEVRAKAMAEPAGRATGNPLQAGAGDAPVASPAGTPTGEEPSVEPDTRPAQGAREFVAATVLDRLSPLVRSFKSMPDARRAGMNGQMHAAPDSIQRARGGSTGWTLLPLAAVTVLLAVPLIAWGLWPHQLAVLAGLPPGSVPTTLAQALAGTRRSVWIGLVVAGLGGCALGWLRSRIFQGMRGWQEGVLAVVSLEWADQAVNFALQVAGSGLRYFARLGEGEGYIGWLALAALVLWVLLRS